jgi:hypothetical protein
MVLFCESLSVHGSQRCKVVKIDFQGKGSDPGQKNGQNVVDIRNMKKRVRK